jgi:hypothetical protein
VVTDGFADFFSRGEIPERSALQYRQRFLIRALRGMIAL